MIRNILINLLILTFFWKGKIKDEDFIIHIADPKKGKLEMYWADSEGKPFRSFRNVKKELEKKGQKLIFAMNGGMYEEDRSPVGLYIQSGRELNRINLKKGKGNFYTMPNGVFSVLKDGTADISVSDKIPSLSKIRFATQSGPMLLVGGEIPKKYSKNSALRKIRNGVGLLSDGKVIFAVNKKELNIHEFALFFKEKGCKEALYLDGTISSVYLPEKGEDFLGGDFGVIITERE